MSNKWYSDLSGLIRLIIAIIPITSYVVHALARITSGKLINIVVGIISLFGLGLVFWVVDLITTILGMGLFFTK